MGDDATNAPSAGLEPRFRLRGLLVSLLPTLVLPVVLYQVLIGRGVATIPALTATAIFPLGSVLFVLPVPVFLVVSPAVGTAMTVGLIARSVAYGRRMSERGQTAAALQSAHPDEPGA